MAMQKACRNCKSLVDGNKCPLCGGTDIAENSKGKVNILDPEQSEIAKHLKIKQKGNYAIKLG
jgi:DNA-directed RNA polymerase subunit E"